MNFWPEVVTKPVTVVGVEDGATEVAEAEVELAGAEAGTETEDEVVAVPGTHSIFGR